VLSITDGDTIVVEIEGVDYKVRYIGMDCPESGNGLGLSATEKNKELVLGKSVILVKDSSETDRYGRLLRYVIVGDVFVNEYLVRLGLAEASSYPPDTSCDNQYSSSQSVAQSGFLGMWNQPQVTPNSRFVSPTITEPAQPVCNCSVNYNCSDFSSHSAAQSCFNYCGGSTSYNFAGLDRDRDGSACESLP